jgi:peptide/nickel transport system substrate-binding protein
VRPALAAVAAALALAAAPAPAQELRVGLGAMTRSIDPHFANTGPDVAQSLHLFDKLILQDESQKLVPGLATAWRVAGERAWELDLREGVRFHDGSPFTAEDVVFTVRRAVDVPNSSSPFTTYLRGIERVEVLGPHRIRVHTKQPSPLLPWDLSTFGIVSRRAGEGASTADYNAGKAAIGTGPYRFVEFVPNERIVVERNDAYWGGREPWARVVFRLVPNPAVRSAALQAGDVDVVDTVAAQDLERLRATPGIGVWRAPSNRVIYLLMDSFRESTPNIRDAEGRPLATNPLRDRRVRLALSSAIARDALVERVLEGEGIELPPKNGSIC